MAQHHDELLTAGARVFGISVDSPAQQAAMVDKLRLPFPLISDPDRSAIIEPLGLADPDDHRNIAIPSLVLFSPDEQQQLWRFTSRDFADRMPEEEVVATVREQGWAPAQQPAPTLGSIEAGPNAVSLDWLVPYLRGARFAALAMGLRHKDLDPSIKTDSKAYVAEMDRFTEAVRDLRKRRRSNEG